MKFGFVAKHRGIWPADWLCGALGVSRGGFYAWLRRPRSQRSRSDEELGAKVRSSFLASDRTYGARRVWHDMLAEGVSCGLHRIERLMRLQALKARPRRRRLPPGLGERQVAAVAPNVLNRTFDAPAPNRKWIADFTYVWTAEGWRATFKLTRKKSFANLADSAITVWAKCRYQITFSLRQEAASSLSRRRGRPSARWRTLLAVAPIGSAQRLPSSTKRIAVQVAFDNFGHAIQDVNATTSTTSPPVSTPVAFNARGDELLGCFLLERIYSVTVRGRANRWSHDALIKLGLSNSANAARNPAHKRAAD